VNPDDPRIFWVYDPSDRKWHVAPPGVKNARAACGRVIPEGGRQIAQGPREDRCAVCLTKLPDMVEVPKVG
jgi:hypothetical protein